MNGLLRRPRVFNLIFQGLLLLTLFQQVYFPQQYKYLHLAVILVRMLISEMYDQEYRAHRLDQWFIPVVLATTAVSFIENIANVQLGIIYLVCLMAALIMLLMIIRDVILDSRLKQSAYKLHPKHIKMIESGKRFVYVIFYAMYTTVLIGLVYSFYEIIKLFLS